MKLFEYMAHGKAIVCSDFPVMREVIEPGATGLLVASDDSDAWANAISVLREDPRLRTALGSSGQEKLNRQFTWRHRAQKILEGIA
jgi:glycosyltransferase involved in cell wall biosynthesis